MTTMTRPDPSLTFDPDGTLRLDFGPTRQAFREAICPECGEPIRWMMDMSSFTSGPRPALAHARCVWRQEGFRTEMERAQPDL